MVYILEYLVLQICDLGKAWYIDEISLFGTSKLISKYLIKCFYSNILKSLQVTLSYLMDYFIQH